MYIEKNKACIPQFCQFAEQVTVTAYANKTRKNAKKNVKIQ